MSRSGSRSPARRSPPRREDHGRGSGSAPGNKVFVGNIGFDVTEKELEEAFSKYGKVSEALLAVDGFSKKPRGFAFVTMETDADAEKAADDLNGREMFGRKITAEISHGKGGNRKRDEGSREMQEARASGACYDWIKGRCSRGDDCRFKHESSGYRSGGGRDRDRDRGGRDRDYDRRDRSRERDSGRRDRSRDRRDRSRDRDSGRRERSRDRRDRSRERDYDRGGRDRSRDRR